MTEQTKARIARLIESAPDGFWEKPEHFQMIMIHGDKVVFAVAPDSIALERGAGIESVNDSYINPMLGNLFAEEHEKRCREYEQEQFAKMNAKFQEYREKRQAAIDESAAVVKCVSLVGAR